MINNRPANFIIFVLLSLLIFSTQNANGNSLNEKNNILPGYFVVKFKQGTKIDPVESFQSFHVTKIPTIDSLNMIHNVSIIKKAFPILPRSKNKSEIDISRFYIFSVPKKVEIKLVVEDYNKNSNIEYAEPIYYRHFFSTPNDQYFSLQWGLKKIEAEKGWDYTTGDNKAIISIIDSGVDWNHPDLFDNIWNNEDEIPNNGIDDDNNGKIDDVYGWDFYFNDNNPTDEYGHGTHCAGIASAVTNNNIGISGLGWNCKIMPLKISGNSNKVGYWLDAIAYAVDNGAKIISMSFGDDQYSQFEQDVINWAYSHNCVLVAAAGNNNTNTPHYPAAYDHVLAVSATDLKDVRSIWPLNGGASNYGIWVDVSAPGTDILSTVPTYYVPLNPYLMQYLKMDGTSMACPLVAGLAGLITSFHSEWTNDKIVNQIKNTADNVNNLNPGFQGLLGTGRINVHKALSSGIAYKLSSTANPSYIVSNGQSSATINSEIQDQYGNLVPDATNEITFTITSGSASAQLIGSNPVIAVSGVATIILQSTTVPGTATIKASSPNLTSDSTNVYVYSSTNPTEVGGEIKTNTTWALANSPYLVTSDVFVHNNALLIIEPGVTVLFNSGTGLRIAGDYWQGDPGSLSAEGNAANPIIFTSASGNIGDWKGILFDDHSDRNVSLILSHCIVEKAGQANVRGINANIHCFNTNTPALSNCTISNSSGYGIYLQSSSPSISNNKIINSSTSEVIYLNISSSTINGNTITGNGSSYWLYCATNGTNPTITNNTFTGNVTRSVRLGTNFQLNGNSFTGATDVSIEIWGGDLNTTRTWRQQTGSCDYKIVSSDLYVHSNGSLRIEPGVKLLFNSGTGLRIAGDYWQGDSGSLSAEGNAANPIIFTSASGNIGDWKGILFDDHSDRNVSSILSHCIVEKAGQANAHNINSAVFCRYTNMPTITNCVIQNNGAVGLDFDHASPSANKSKIINNTSYGIYCNISSHPTIGNATGATNDIYGNGTYDIYVAGADNINARYNYWGTTNEAQIKARIYDKYDNPNSGEVFYSPWATESGGANQPPTAFSLFSPLNNSIIKTLTPTLTWQKSEDVDGSTEPIYTVQVGTDSSFTKDYYEFYNIQQANYTLSQPLTDKTKYFWRVIATDEDNASTWSNEVWRFTIDLSAQNHSPSMPTVLLPINGEEAPPGDYLVWTKSNDPDLGDVITYTLELDNNSNFTSPEIHQSGISGDKMNNEAVLDKLTEELATEAANAVYIRIISLQNYTNLKDDSTYYWRVKAVDNYGAESNFTSSTSRFFFNKTNTAPQPVIAGFSPKDGLEVRTNKPEISWHPAKDADLSDHVGMLRYNLQLDDDGEFFSNYQYQYTTGIGLNTFEVPDPLTENAKWYYRVQVIDDEGLTSAWSTIQNFWVNAIDEAPAPFVLYYPANNSAVTADSLTFSWGSTFDVDPNDKFSFTLEYSANSSFTDNLIAVPNLTDSCFAVDTKGMSKTTYYWRAKAIDSDGLVTWGSNSGTTPWSFQFNPTIVNDGDYLNIPKEFSLSQNHPNPFNPETVIEYQLPRSSHVIITIYNTIGQEIKTLIDGEQQAGYQQIIWDGTDNSGKKVGTGIYLYQLKTEEFVAVKKMIMIQ